MKRLSSIVTALCLALTIFTGTLLSATAIDIEKSADNLKVTEILPDKSRYNPGETAKLTVTVENESSESLSSEIKIYISHLENNVDTLTSPVRAEANASSDVEVEWTVPENDFTGYYAKAVIGDSSASTAIDCSSDISVFPRYGYVGEYDGDATKTEQTANTIALLSKKYHINAYQFYDWQWRHDDYVKYDENGNVAKEWDDLFQRKISSDTVKAYIASAQNCGSKALAYVQNYSARENYEEHGVSPEDGLYRDTNHQNQWMLDFGQTKLYQFDPNSESWQKKMISEYKKIVNDMGFDGLQIDQLGYNGAMYSYDGKNVDYGKGFASIVNATKAALNLNNQNKSIITFNMVGGWPADNILSSTTNTDFNFSELWGEHNSYNSVRNWTEKARTDGGKAFVLAAYLNYYDNPSDGAFSEPSMRLTNATISASGASHIEIGAKENEITMLCNEYYPNTRLKLRSSHLEALKNYYDFITAYENLLYDSDIDYYADNTLEIDGEDISKNAAAGKVWYMTRQNEKYDIIHLINLTGEDDDTWRNPTSAPQTKTDLKAKYYLSGNDTAKGVYLASPDSDSCESKAVEFTQGSDDNGNYIEFTLPSLEYWDMVYVSKSNDNADSGEKYYDAYRATLEGGANRATNHTGYIGHGFVDRFGAVGTAVTFNVKVKTAGSYTLNFRYANSCGFGKDSYPTLYIDGEKIQELNFKENGLSTLADYAGWNTWSENTEVTTNLTAGTHRIKVIYERETNASNLDGLTLVSADANETTTADSAASTTTVASQTTTATTAPTTAEPTTSSSDGAFYDAAEATLSGGATTNTNHTGYTGKGFVDKFGEVGSAITFNVNVKESGIYTLDFRYANACGDGKDARPTLYIDGNKIKDLTFTENGKSSLEGFAGWNYWSNNTEVSTDLTAGAHTIKIVYETASYSSNVDGLTLIANNVTTTAPTTAAPTTTAPTTSAPTTTAPTTAPTTTAPTTVAPTTSPTTIVNPIIYGDSNGDGIVNLLDLISMRKHLAKWSVEVDKQATDCNADGNINLLDLILMRKYLAKWNVVLGPQN